METNPANEVAEYNKLGICMKSFANNFGMACGCEKCLEDIKKLLWKLKNNVEKDKIKTGVN